MTWPAWLISAWAWLKKYWKWLLLPIGILLFVLGRFTRKKIEVTSFELHEYAKRREELESSLANKLGKVEEDKAKKLAELEAEHSEAISKMTDDQKRQVEELRQDPEELQRFLLNVGREVRGQ